MYLHGLHQVVGRNLNNLPLVRLQTNKGKVALDILAPEPYIAALAEIRLNVVHGISHIMEHNERALLLIESLDFETMLVEDMAAGLFSLEDAGVDFGEEECSCVGW